MMTNTIDSSLFRFVSVRPPRRLLKPRPDVALIQYEARVTPIFIPDSPQARPIGPDPTQLYDRLVAIRAANGTRQEMEQAVLLFRGTSDWIRYPSELALRAKFYADFRKMPAPASDPGLYATVERALGIRIADYITSGAAIVEERRLFHNLFSAAILPDDVLLREDLLIALKVQQLIKDLHSRHQEPGHGLAPGSESLRPIPTRGIVVLPRTIFPLPAASTVVIPIEPLPVEHVHEEETRAQAIRLLQAAVEDVDRAIREEQATTNVAVATASDGALVSMPAREYAEPTRQLLALSGSEPTLPLREAKTQLETRLTEAMSRAAHDGSSERQFTVGGEHFDMNSVCIPRRPNLCEPYAGGPLPKTPGKPHSMSVADLLVVRQKLQSYVAGEVSHITNVMATETRETRNRHLMRTEETITVERETTTERQRDLQSTERFSLENETKQVIRNESALKAGATISSQGVVTVSASAAYSTMSSQEVATSTATSFAKEVTERALERVTERVREQRSRTTIEEVEESNLHKFENHTAQHIVGIYQWVDKIYLSELYNLGRRLMMTFNVPEPAAFFLHCSALQEHVTLERPLPPDTPGPFGALSSATDITELNYAAFAARYGASGIEPPPPKTLTVGEAFGEKDSDPWVVVHSSIPVPAGYVAKSARTRRGWSTGIGKYVRIQVGDQTTEASGHDYDVLPLHDESGKVPVVIQPAGTYFLATIEIDCERTAEVLQSWRIKTYDAILAAYESRKSEYERTALSHVTARSFSPTRNREIEQEELKRSAIQLLSGQNFDFLSAMKINQAQGYPELSAARAELEGPYIDFFERACDWSNMTYLFRPYFWTRKPNWVAMRQYETDDALFTRFLQAGAAEVLVPVQPAYARAMLHYLETGEVGNADDFPVHDEAHLSIIHDLMKGEALETTPSLLSSWQVKVPTTLTMLRTGPDQATLPDWSDQ